MSNADQAAFWTAQDSWLTYQAQMDLCIGPVLDLVLDRAPLAAGLKVLDIGCGTGASVEALAHLVGPGGHVLGVDIAPTLLGMARERCAALPNVTLMEADAQTAQLPFHCDLAVSRFGVMFFEDTPAAFANIAQALRPGATITCSAWSLVQDNPFFLYAAQAAKTVFGPMPKTDRSLPGPFAFEHVDRVQRDFAQAGLVDTTIETVGIHLTPPGNLTDFATLCMAIGPAASAIQYFEASTDKIADLSQALEEIYAPFETTDGLKIPASIHVIQAATPT